ncbi:germinal-center associated nuclear protein [Bufo bufo]|uniref:germinal-center associated nuclear protein n=1 Tax=Bufo bufo TaxID=8384 RepID=UPI001ABEB258|nr:germinal-center associated nuclear protein [Bufo bufo]XP_040297775.1 germinal-center associated nuclear protein [Bufo bufo]XP_040297776.1 germinal-center associated nuclear protein [Bufo bufo]
MSNLFGGQQISSANAQNQNTAMFGQTLLFGQNAPAQSTPAFGQPSMGQTAPMFGQLGNNQSVFGQNTSSQSSMFGQTNPAQTTSAFGQTSGGLSAPTFGQGSSGLTGPVFGQTGSGQSGSIFGQAAGGQSNSVFGQGTSVQSAPTFGQTTNVQSTSTFGQATSGSVFGLATSGQTAPLFGQASSGQSVPSFGQSGPAFGQGTSSQSTPVFGQSTSSQSTSVFGQATSGASAPTFGQASSAPLAPAFGQSTLGQSGFNFGQTSSSQSANPFPQQSLGQTGSVFGLATTRQSSSLFGQASNSQSVPAFGQTPTGQTGPTFGKGSTNQSSIFGQTANSISASHFAQVPSSQSTSLFAQATTDQSASFFTQPTTSQSSSPFGSSGSVFGQATSGTSSTPRQPEDGSNQGSQSPGSRFLFGQTSSGPTPLFGLNTAGQTFGQTGSQSGQDGKSQISGFGQVNSGQSNFFGQPPGFQSAFTKQEAGSEFGQPPSALPSTTAFGIAQSSQISKAETSEKTSVFGQQSNISGSVFGTNTQISTGSSVVDSKFPTNMTSSPFTQVSSNSEHSFKPVHTTFKPILSGTSKSDETSSSSFSMSGKSESKDQSIFGSSTASSTSGNVNFFSLSSDKKSKVETSPSRPSFASANSSFTSFPEESRRDEGLKGVKRKEEHNRSPLRSDVATSGEPSSDLHSEHQPVKRSGRLNRDLRGGANIYVRSLFDVVKSQMKTPDRRDVKKEDNAPKPTDTDPPPSNQSFGRNLSSSSPNQTESAKAISAPLSSQVAFTKPQMTATSQAQSTRMVSFVRPNQQGSVREHSSTGTSELIPGRIKPLLEEGELLQEIGDTSSMTATKQGKHPSSAEHSVPVSPSELTAFYVKDLPNNQNKKAVLQDFFKKYGKIQRITCRTAQKIAFIQFNNHNCAAMAKKAVKKLNKDAVVFWQRKKTSPAKKKGTQSQQREEKPNEQESIGVVSPVHKPVLRGLKGSPVKKATFSKTLQFSVDNTDSSAPFSDTTVPLPASLLHLVGTVAETSEEKYRLLDQRDKILRQARVKRTGLDQAKTFVGTCPDMCPEKERYMRDTRNQLSIYEFLPGTDKLDHAAAIKEYSRSSADQEEPLPHELRPVPVLCMTMDYLVNHIMHLGEDNYRDWYDFVWNRTRGIRKDITQQHLCDPLTVSLMEKCMRFHIHCAYQLCEEPMSSFDPRINNENLTKCLQSLKEMYQDLQNRGETYPCEPEFRGYSVLLNLNKGDILREVQQFPESVRNSEEVKFAVQVFAALNSTNFVRFFRLVRSASYLSSCILHCFFPQIRRDALRALNVAYTISYQRPSLFPLENIVSLLFFQDAGEATDFLTAYGLSVSEGLVELNRAAITEPDAPLRPKRCSYISLKHQGSVGEVVNGAPLPQFSMHMPVCSFDAQNKYTGSSSIYEPEPKILLELTEKPSEEVPIKRTIVLLPEAKESCSVPAQAVFQPIMPPEPPPSPPKSKFSDEDVADVLEEIFDNAVKQLSAPYIESVALYISSALEESSVIADRLLADVILNISGIIAEEELKAETERVKEEKRRKAEEARRIQERERLLSLESRSQCDDLINEVITENIRIISKEELQKAVQLDHNKRVLRCSQNVCDQYVGRYVDEEIFHVARETLYEMQCCSKYIQRWREVLAARKKLRRQMRAFPAAPGSVGRDGKLKALIPSATHDVQALSKGIVNLGQAGKLSVSFTRCQQVREKIFHQLKVQHYFQELLCDAAWMPLELPFLIVKHLPTWKQCIFWKVILALPEISDPDDPTGVLSDWLKAKFCWAGVRPESDHGQQVQTLALYSSLESQGGSLVRVNVCVKTVHGPLTENELEQVELQKQLLGTSGIVLLLPAQSDSDVCQIEALLQLKQLLQAKPFKPPPSLAVLVPSSYSDPETVVEKELNISDLVTSGLISDYNVFSIPDGINDMKGTNMVSSAVQFLLSHCPHSLELRSLPFRQYIEDGVCSAFSNAFYHDKMERKKSGLPAQDPAAIIDLYNDTISFLAEVVSSEQLTELSWPVTEFTCSSGSSLMPPTDWNSPGHLAWLKKAVRCFQLPQMDRPPQGAPWGPVCSMIMDYVSQITQSPSGLPLLFSEVQLLLGRIKKQWFSKEGIAGFTPSVQDIPWDEIIALCINHKLRAWDPPFLSDSKVAQEDLYVYFFEEDLKNFTYPDTWENARLSTHQNVLVTADSPQSTREHSSQTPQTPHSVFAPSEKDTQKLLQTPELSDLESLPSQLNRSLLAEKEEDARFNEKLQQLLLDEPLNASLCLPLYLPIPSLSTSLENSIIVPALQKSSTHSAMYSPTKPDLTVCSPSLRPSVKDRIKELNMKLRGNQQEDIAFSLHLSTLLDVGKIEQGSSSPK